MGEFDEMDEDDVRNPHWCEHANETPLLCPCPPICVCKTTMCAPRSCRVPSSPQRVIVSPPAISDSAISRFEVELERARATRRRGVRDVSDTAPRIDPDVVASALGADPTPRRYDPASPQAQVGRAGEERAFRLVAEALGSSTVFIRRGSEDGRANGIMGDITLSPSQIDAAVVGIEVKTAGARYPDSFCISKFEVEESLAQWVMVMSEDRDAGVWVVRMSDARRYLSDKGTYYVCRPPLSLRVGFSEFIRQVEAAAQMRSEG